MSSFITFIEGLGVVPTSAQRVLFSVGCDGVQPCAFEGEARELARTIFGDIETISAHARRTLVLLKGARVGGSYLSALRLLHLALSIPLDSLAPGEQATALIVAPDLRLARQTLRYARGAVETVPALERRVEADGKDGFTLVRPDGQRVTIEALPASRGGASLRSRSLAGAAMSEAAFFRDPDTGIINDADVHAAIAPRLMPGAQLLIESTPWAEAGLLFDLFKENYPAPGNQAPARSALVALAPTLVMRDTPEMRALVESEEQRDPENAAREFHARFMTAGSGLFFDGAVIDARVNAALTGESPLPRDARWTTSAGADFAFVRDSSALVVCAFDGRKIVVMRVLEQRPQPGAPLKPSAVVGAFASEARTYGANGVHADGHYRESIREHLDAAKLEIFPGPEGQSGKAAQYIHFKQLLNENEIELPNHPRLLAQLKAIISRPAPGGGLTISSPRGKSGHGDIVSALVLAAWGLRHINQPQERLMVGRASTRGGLPNRR